METTIITVCGLVTLFGLAITAKCVQAQKRIQWLMPSSTAVAFQAKVSVVIPARNEEYDIAPALRSILSQEGVDLEVIVVNDHSTDRTAEIVDRADCRVLYLLYSICAFLALSSFTAIVLMVYRGYLTSLGW